MSVTFVTKVRTAVNDNNVVVFNLMINCMSAERQFDLAKLGIDLDKLPKASRKLIQEKIFPKEFLNNYGRLRDRANAVLDKGAAVRVELGVVSSRTEAVSKIEQLNAIKADWAKQIDNDSRRYNDICNQRISLIAAEAYKENVPVNVVNTLVDALRKRQPTWEDFVSRMKFEYSAMPIQLELDETKVDFDPVLFQAQKEGIVALREGVFGALVQYLVRESNEILKVLNGKKPHHGGYSINYRTVSRIGEITSKLHGLAFVHQNVTPLASVIDDALAFMPQSVEKDLVLPPGAFLNLIACLEAMGDQHELLTRLRDKQPLVVVSQMPLIQVPGGAVQSTPVSAAPAAAQGVATAASVAVPAAPSTPVVEADEEVEEADANSLQEDEALAADTDASQEEEAQGTEESNVFGLPFMGSSLFD